VTNDGCDTANGYACDLSNAGNYACFTPPNDVEACGMCDEGNGPWCKPGMTCSSSGTCTHYCCDDGDCGQGAKCDMAAQQIPNATIGICVPAM
jgi:hypothetical protein